MKKFIVFCLILIVTVSVGVTVWYFVRDNEELVINMDPYVYMNKGDVLEVDAQLKNAKVGNELSINSLNENVLVWNPYLKAFDAVEGGAAVIEIKVKSGSISPVYIEVSVGNGGKETPYYIDSEAKLLSIGEDVFKADDNYILMQDISLSSSIKPLISNGKFTGSFNGNGYSIKGLKIETTEGVANAGLFAKIGENGVVSNLTLSNVSINGQFETAGAIAGVNEGTITRCSVVDGEVKSTYVDSGSNNGASVGGICGIVSYSNSNVGRVDRCSSSVSVVGTGNVGGLVGVNEGAIVINSYVKLSDGNSVQTLKDNSNIGGLVGLNTYKMNSTVVKVATIKNCYIIGDVKVGEGVENTDIKLGAVIGLNRESSISQSNNLMGIYTNSSNVLVNHEQERIVEEDSAEAINFRGIYNKFPMSSDGKEIDINQLKSYVSRKIQSTSSISGDYDTIWDTATVKWDFVNVWSKGNEDIYPVLNAGGASVADEINIVYDPSVILNETDFREFVTAVNEGTAKDYYVLGNDITFSGDYVPAGILKPFNGTFEGNGHTISGINISSKVITKTAKFYAGLFANTTSNAIVQNLTVKEIKIGEGAKYAGAIVANNAGTIRNCVVKQDVKFVDECNIIGSSYVGGIAGKNLGVIENCKVSNQTIWSKCEIVDGVSKEDSPRFVGGIAGMNGAANSSATATIKNSSVVRSEIKDVLNKTAYDSNLGYDFKSNFNNIKYYVGGISGANFYLIKSNYLFETDVTANEYSKYGEVAGIVAFSKSEPLINAEVVELSDNRLVGGNITGYIAAGLVCEQYGRAEHNQLGCANEYYIDSETGVKIRYTTVIKGAEIAGITNKLYNGARLFNCFAGSHLLNTIPGTGHTAGFCNVNDYYCYKRFFGEEAIYGQFGQLFSLCTIEDSTYNKSRYDCNTDYRNESHFIYTTRNSGYGNNVIWIETSSASYDDSVELLGVLSDSEQTNIKRLGSLEEARVSATDDSLQSVFKNFAFDDRWDFTELEFPCLNGLPEITELD